MTDEEERQAQMLAAMNAIQSAVLKLLQEGEAHPQLVILAMARVTAELGASMALAGDQDLEKLLDEVVEIVRQVGRDHHEALQVVTMPPAGRA
jgi:hypothetical protein